MELMYARTWTATRRHLTSRNGTSESKTLCGGRIVLSEYYLDDAGVEQRIPLEDLFLEVSERKPDCARCARSEAKLAPLAYQASTHGGSDPDERFIVYRCAGAWTVRDQETDRDVFDSDSSEATARQRAHQLNAEHDPGNHWRTPRARTERTATAYNEVSSEVGDVAFLFRLRNREEDDAHPRLMKAAVLAALGEAGLLEQTDPAADARDLAEFKGRGGLEVPAVEVHGRSGWNA